VWQSNGNSPGLAMTRSIGDKIGAQAGVSAEPEILEFKRTYEDRFIVIASDGVWEFLSNVEVMNIVRPYYSNNSVDEASERLI
jgi:serine/threonine protein phosphatase PrpC